KPVLRRHAAGSNVQGMVGKQFVSATCNQLQAETATGFANVFSLTAKVGLQISFLGERNRGYKTHYRKHNPTHANPPKSVRYFFRPRLTLPPFILALGLRFRTRRFSSSAAISSSRSL